MLIVTLSFWENVGHKMSWRKTSSETVISTGRTCCEDVCLQERHWASDKKTKTYFNNFVVAHKRDWSNVPWKLCQSLLYHQSQNSEILKSALGCFSSVLGFARLLKCILGEVIGLCVPVTVHGDILRVQLLTLFSHNSTHKSTYTKCKTLQISSKKITLLSKLFNLFPKCFFASK